MKKESKRKIKDYEDYEYFQFEYYGLLPKRGKLRVDVKRFTDKCYLNNEKKELLNKPRKTSYFRPEKISRYDYKFNIFKDRLQIVKSEWNNEVKKAMEKVMTPRQAEDNERTGYWMQTGILEYDEVQMHATMQGIKRQSVWAKIMVSFYAQFIHQFASNVESTTIKVLTESGFNVEHFSRNVFKTLYNGATKMNLEDISTYPRYDKFYKIWNFLKHNSVTAYDKLYDNFPEVFNTGYGGKKIEYLNGDLAIYFIKLDEELIDELFEGLQLFFEELCISMFKENVIESEWNYDDWFYQQAKDKIEEWDNPMGLPDYI